MGHVNILQSTGQEKLKTKLKQTNKHKTTTTKQVRDLAFHLLFHRFSTVNCCLNVVS